MKKVRWLFVVVLTGAGAIAWWSHAAAPKSIDELMQKKLTSAQKVLEGLALNDFGKIQQNASELIHVSKQAEWRVFKTPQYELQSNEFRRIADSLAERAKEKNLDGSALAYVELTLACVRCHKYVREVRQASNDSPERVARAD